MKVEHFQGPQLTGREWGGLETIRAFTNVPGSNFKELPSEYLISFPWMAVSPHLLATHAGINYTLPHRIPQFLY